MISSEHIFGGQRAGHGDSSSKSNPLDVSSTSSDERLSVRARIKWANDEDARLRICLKYLLARGNEDVNTFFGYDAPDEKQEVLSSWTYDPRRDSCQPFLSLSSLSLNPRIEVNDNDVSRPG